MAATDILTRAEGGAALNMTTADQTANATELDQVVSAASAFCDEVFGPVVVRNVTGTFDGGGRRIWLTPPVFSITSVKEYAGGAETVLSAEAVASSTANDYYFDSVLGAISRRSSWNDAYFGAQRVVVVYVAGRYTDAASCAPWAKEACAEAVIHFWQARGANSGAANFGGDGAPFGGVPFSTEQLRKKLRAMYPSQALPAAVA